MKRKLFFIWAALLSFMCASPLLADDIQDLRNAGWTQVTSLEDAGDNYYVLVDAASGNYCVGRGLAADHRPMSHTLGNPFADNNQVWMLEGSGSTFKLKSMKDGYYLNAGSAGWNNSMNQTDGTDLNFTLSDGKYSINCSTGYLGPWNNDNKVALTDAAENIAVNKQASQAPGYYIFAMSRTEYNSRVYDASKLEEQGWKKASNIADVAGEDYYVIFLESKGGSMTIAATESERPAYKTLNDPLKSSYLLWTLVSDGTNYALKNIASQTFFNAQDWDTGFGATANAYRKFISLGDNKYALQNSSNNYYVGRWQNEESAPFEMENVAANKSEAHRGVYYVYYMTKSDYNAKRASAIATAADGASVSAPAELTGFIYNPSFSDLNKYPWRESGGRGNAQFAANAAEYWNCNNAIFSQTITNLPNGKYRIVAQAVNPDNGSSAGAKIFANDAETAVTAQVASNNYGVVSALLMKDPELGITTVETIVNNKELTLGMKAATGWTIFDNFKLFYCGEDLSDYQPTFETALSNAKASAGKPMAETYKNELTRVLNLYDKDFSSFSNVEDIIKAINDLQTATTNAQPSIHSYEQGNAINALISAGKTDVTAGVINASCATLDDWTIDNTSTFHVNTWSGEGASDGTGMTTPFIENWVAKGSLLGNATIKHTLIDNLTAGYYQVEILARVYSEAGLNGAPISGGTFNVNEKSIDLGSGNTFVYNNMEGVYNTYKAVVQVAANGSLDINFGINSANFNWLAFKNLKVTYLGTNVSAGTITTNVKEGEYVQSGQVVRITMDNTTAVYTLKAGSKVTLNGTSYNLTAIDGGAEFTLPATLQTSKTYTISIPAGILTSNIGNSTAYSLTVNTPAVFDGTYFVKTSDGRYLSRGNNYNTRAIVDNYGVAAKIATNAENVSTFTFADSNLKLFDANDGNIYTDKTNYPNWTIVATDGGCNIINANNRATNGNPIAIEANTDATYKYDRLVTKDGLTAAVFTFETPADHIAKMASAKNAQAAAVAAEWGHSELTTKAAIDAYLASEVAASTLVAQPIDITGAKGEIYQNVGDINETKEGLPNGLYKVTVNAFSRITYNPAALDDETRGIYMPNASLYANGQEIQLYSPYEQTSTSATAWSDATPADVVLAGNYIPNNTTSAEKAFEAGNYKNEIYVYVTDGKLKFGIYKAGKVGNGDWLYYNNFTVTGYFSAADAARAELGNAIKDVALPTANISEAAPFKFNKTEVDKAKAIIEEAKALISNVSATIEQVEAMKTKVEGIKAVSVNEGGYFSLYNVILKYEGYEHNNKLVSAYENGDPSKGGYSMGYYARGTQPIQNLRLMPNGDGTYAIAFNDGTVFVCTGVVYGGDTRQLRATTDGSKALAVKIQPSMTEEGIVTLFNTEANMYIGAQNESFYTVNSHNYFTIALVGDINLDEKVDADDVTAMAQVINEEYEGTHGEGDINNDGKASISDVATLVDIIQPKTATKVVAKVYAEQLASENATPDYAVVSATSMTDNSDVKSTITAADYFTTLNVKTTLANVASISVYSVDKKAIAGDMIAINANGKVRAIYAQGEENTYTHARYAQSDVVTVTGNNAGTYTAYLFPVELTNGVIVTVRTTDGSFYSQTFTGINAGKANELTFTETTATNNWMATIPGNTYFSKISTPGAHDACTKGNTYVAECQDLTLQELLDAGVRQFDLRPGYLNNTTITAENLYIWHGVTKTSTKYVDAIKMLADFVQAHPTEAISVIMVKENNSVPTYTDRSNEMWSVVNDCHTTYKDYMKVLDHSYYTLDDFRGKICYINRTRTDVNNTTQISNWPDDNTVSDFSCKIGNTCSANVQDKYGSNGTTKQTAVKDMINQSKEDTDRSHFYYNYLSSSNSPSKYAGSTNPAIATFLDTVSGPTGYLLCDYIGCETNSGKTLLNAIINQNYKYVYNGRSRK